MAATAAQTRVKEAVENSLEKLERDQLRPLQAKGHSCAAKCCENQKGSKDEVQNCLSQCFVPIQQAQEYLGKELNNFQNRLSRCAQQCQDKIQDNVNSNTTHADMSRYQDQLNACIDQCCSSHMELVPKMFERMKKTISSIQAASPH